MSGWRAIAVTLQALEADGMVLRVSRPIVPLHVDYSLTSLGREAARKVRGLADWVETNMPRITAAQTARRRAA